MRVWSCHAVAAGGGVAVDDFDIDTYVAPRSIANASSLGATPTGGQRRFCPGVSGQQGLRHTVRYWGGTHPLYPW
jgi:hypothetical protein